MITNTVIWKYHKKTELMSQLRFWYAWWDSNPHLSDSKSAMSSVA